MNVNNVSSQIIDGVEINTHFDKGPFFMDGVDTICSLFLQRCKQLQKKVVHREKELGIWKSYTWNDFYSNVRLISLGLNELGFLRGDKASILAEDCKEWIYADFAVQCLGGVSTGVYTTDSSEQLLYQLTDSDSTFLFLDTDEQLDKYLTIAADCPKIKKAIVFERKDLFDFKHEKVIFLDELYKIGEQALKKKPDLFETEISKNKASDVAIMVYTSGTTGHPKGVMLTNENLIYAISVGKVYLPSNETDELFCFLPLCHVYERLTSCMKPLSDKSTINFAESMETVFEDIREVSPTLFYGVPRIYEKINSNFNIALSEATNFSKFIYDRALKTSLKRVELKMKNKKIPIVLNIKFFMYEFFVFRNLRRMIGFDRVKRAVTGAAPISPDLVKWFNALGIPLIEGYGMSETATVMTMNDPENNEVGTVGTWVPDANVKISPEGEIQWKSPAVFAGYYKDNKRTSEAFTKDGYFKTGDKGKIENGLLSITGRLKDIIITAGGKNISPALIENYLKFSKYISDAIVIGDQRKYLTALILIDQENVEKFAQQNRIQYSDFSSLCNTSEVKKLIAGEVDLVNLKLARVEQVKKFRLIDMLLTAEDDEMTATMKLRRSYCETKYEDLINSMY